MTDEKWMDFERQNFLLFQREAAFGQASALYGYRFENDNGSVPQMKVARNYVEHWNDMRRKNIGHVFWGLVGNGKTFAAACIANALVDRFIDVKMTTLGTVLNKLPGMTAQDKEKHIKSLCECELLILDDFGMERQTDYAQEQIYTIINGRCVSGKPLIMTTNLSLQEMKHPKDRHEQRIFDRVFQMCVPVCFDGESLRQAQAKENLDLYKQIVGL